MVNVRDYGAVGSGCTDDRAAFQAALDAGAGGEVYIPNGTYRLGHTEGTFWCLNIPAGTTLRGESRDGVVLLSAPGVPDSVQLLEVNAPDVTVCRMTLDGNIANQTVSPKQQRHGVRCKGAPRCTVTDVVARHFTGDGLYFYDGSNDPHVSGVRCERNQRNGLTLGGGTEGGTFVNSQFLGNGAQQFDSEGGLPISDVTVTGCLMDALGMSDDYVLTMTGHSSDTQSRRWTVAHNQVNGPALAVHMADLVYAHNVGVNRTSKPSMYIYRSCDGVLVHHNTFIYEGAAGFDAAGVIYVCGTGLGQSPGGVVISRNEIQTSTLCNGISAICVRDLDVLDNVLVGSGIPGSWSCGLWARVTKADVPLERARIRGNRIRNFGRCGVMVGGNGTAQIKRIDVIDNEFTDDASGAMLYGMSLDDDAYHPVLEATQYGNTISGGTTEMVYRTPPGVVAQPWGDGSRWATVQ